MKHFTLIFIALTVFNSLKAQIIAANDGEIVSVSPNTDVSVIGGLLNKNAGEFHNSGSIYVNDTVWNIAGNRMFFNSLPGKVRLNGGNQIVGGTDFIYFYRLDLIGSGIKTLANSEFVENTLDLGDRELFTRTHNMHVLNGNTSAILRNTGFVNSDNGGWLYRFVNQDSTYLYPVGIAGKYRPTTIKPSVTTPDSFAVRFAPVLPTIEGYDINQKDTTLCIVNPDFYHQVKRTSGNFAADLELYFAASDPVKETIAHWDASNMWKDLSPVNTNASSLTKIGQNLFNPVAFAFANIKPQAALVISNPTICTNAPSITLNGTPVGGVFSGNGVSGNTFDPILAGPGTHTIQYIFTSALGCSDTAFQSITVLQAPNIQITTSSQFICEGETAVLNAGLGYTNYNWFDENNVNVGTTQTINVLNSGLFYVTADSNGCSSKSDTFRVTVKPLPNPQIQSNRNYNLCQGESITLSLQTNYASYSWFENNNLLGTNSSITVSTAGSYTVLVDSNGCTNYSNPFIVTVRPLPVAEINVLGNLTFCEGKDSVILTASPSSAYFWDPTGETTQSIIVKESGIYTLTVSDSCGTAISTPTTITVNPNPIANFGWSTVFPEMFSPLNFVDSSSNNTVTWLWEFGDGQTSTLENPDHIYESGGKFEVILTVSTGSCEDSIHKFIEISDDFTLFLPNIFSPNDDGPVENEFMTVYGRGIKEYNMQIFNRWGTLIWQTQNLKEFWNGKTQSGQPVPEDAYAYKVFGTTIKNRKFERVGTVTVIR